MVLLLTLQIVLFAYHIFILWFEVPPFNKVENFSFTERIVETLLHVIVYLASILAVYYGWVDIQNGTLMFYFALFGVGIMVWWIPFIVGPNKKWREQYAKLFATQLKVFPTKRAVVPTIEIFIQHALLAAIVVVFLCFRMKIIQ